GNMLPTNDNPVVLAEQVAMADVISGGRIISGVVRGIGIESWATNTIPNFNRERFEECHDLMLATWTRPGPFRWEGKHYHFRVVNPCVLPIQKPHPPIWVPGTGSPQTLERAARHPRPANLGAWHGQPGDHRVGCPTPLHLCGLPGAARCLGAPLRHVP